MIALAKLMPAWAWALLGGLVLAGLVGGGQTIRVVALQTDLKTERDARLADASKLGACRETRGSLLVQVGEQNQALAGLRQAEAQRSQAIRKAQEKVRHEAEQDYQAANRLQQERTGGDACTASETVIDKELGL